MPHRPNGPIMMFVFCLLGLIATARSASAEVTRTEFTSKQPYGTFRVGDYVIWQGRIHGDLSPQEAIPGIDKAARNDRGRVAYSARIILIMPAANRSGNGALLVDVPNRGRVYAEALYNSPREAPFVSGTLEQGTGFLQDHGFTIAEVYWELGQGADLPSFVDADGKTRYVEGAGFAIVRDARGLPRARRRRHRRNAQPAQGSDQPHARERKVPGRTIPEDLSPERLQHGGQSARIRWNARFCFGRGPSPNSADRDRTGIERQRHSHLRQSGISRR